MTRTDQIMALAERWSRSCAYAGILEPNDASRALRAEVQKLEDELNALRGVRLKMDMANIRAAVAEAECERLRKYNRG